MSAMPTDKPLLRRLRDCLSQRPTERVATHASTDRLDRAQREARAFLDDRRARLAEDLAQRR